MKHFLLGALLISPTWLMGQLLVDKVIPPSPNAAAIIKYCDHPIGKKTGIAKIKIPLYTVRHNDILVPIDMSYHHLGIRVEEEATWTGLGWHLSAGGMITRIVRGKNDLGIAEKELGSKALGYPFEKIKPCLDDCEERKTEEFKEKVCGGIIDTDPDVFFFEIMGKRGKFLLTPGHSSESGEISINLVSPESMTATFKVGSNSWELTDKRGFKYIFGTRELTETQRNYFDYKYDSHKLLFKYYADLATSTWYLNEVQSPKGARITFNYDVVGGQSLYGTNGNHTRMNINDDHVWDVHYSHYCFPDEIENIQILAENFYNDIYLKQIRFGGNTVRFSTSNREDMKSPASVERTRPAGSDFSIYLNVNKEPQKLDKITINEGGKIRAYDFKYGYFNGNTTDSIPRLSKRLKLLSITESKNGETLKPFQFTYQEKHGLPSKESHARDLWGFFNGEEDIHNITPGDFFNYNQPERILEEKGRNKHFSEDHEKEGILTKIEFPGGHTTEYEYESHDYHNMSSDITGYYQNKMAESNFDHTAKPYVSGGLRIKRVKNTFPFDVLIRDYTYNDSNGNTSGNLAVTSFSHDHKTYGHKSSGNHTIVYDKVEVHTGKIHEGVEFKFKKER